MIKYFLSFVGYYKDKAIFGHGTVDSNFAIQGDEDIEILSNECSKSFEKKTGTKPDTIIILNIKRLPI